MKCPQCGHWNRASFPRCFRCGAPLPEEGEQEAPKWRDEVDQTARPRAVITGDEDGTLSGRSDIGDQLAQEMLNLKERKERGEERQRDLREADGKPGVSVATGRQMQATSRRRVLFTDTNAGYMSNAREDEPLRPDAIPVVSPRKVDYDDFENTLPPAYRPLSDTKAHPARDYDAGRMTERRMRATHSFGLHRFTRVFILLFILVAVFAGGYYFIYRPLQSGGAAAPLQERTLISASIYDDMPAHIIRIPEKENAQIYVKELHKSYTVIGGYATIEVPDYTWYQQEEDIDTETYEVTMTPYIQTSSGDQKPMEQIHFSVDIPLSPLTLVSPDVTYVTVNDRAKYQIQFQVEKGSTVTINNEDYSDLVSTQDGLISYNATVQPIGDNVVTIVTKAKYYRRNTVYLTLYRQPQSIQLELDPTLGTSWASSKPMTVTGTTLNKATITVLSPYENLDTSKLATNGTFSFDATFPLIGTNTIVIKASYPGKEDTFVRYEIYHVPPASEYTRKAWPMDSYNYGEFLDNLELRVQRTQVYVCKGTITEIIASTPQLALMETGTAESSRAVLLENRSTDTWKVGDSLSVYGDAFGSYNGMPRLVGRYTYTYTPK